jgi:hypothetical protein
MGVVMVMVTLMLFAACQNPAGSDNGAANGDAADTGDDSTTGDDTAGDNTAGDDTTGDTDANGHADTGGEDAGTGEDTGTGSGEGPFDNPQECWQADYTTDFYHFFEADHIVKLGPDGAELSNVEVESLDGSDSGLANPRIARAIDIDEEGEKVYWIRRGSAQEHVYRVGLDGTGLEQMSNSQYDEPLALQFVPQNQLIYFIPRFGGFSLEALENDGTGGLTSITPGDSGGSPRAFHVDYDNSLIYWAVTIQGTGGESDTAEVGTTDLDGENWTLISDEFKQVRAMDVSVDDDIIALFGQPDSILGSDALFTMKLDGSDVQEFEVPSDIAIQSITGVVQISAADDRIFWHKDQATYSVTYDGTDFASCPDIELYLAD